jgi:hypothetical protein
MSAVGRLLDAIINMRCAGTGAEQRQSLPARADSAVKHGTDAKLTEDSQLDFLCSVWSVLDFGQHRTTAVHSGLSASLWLY